MKAKVETRDSSQVPSATLHMKSEALPHARLRVIATTNHLEVTATIPPSPQQAHDKMNFPRLLEVAVCGPCFFVKIPGFLPTL